MASESEAEVVYVVGVALMLIAADEWTDVGACAVPLPYAPYGSPGAPMRSHS